MCYTAVVDQSLRDSVQDSLPAGVDAFDSPVFAELSLLRKSIFIEYLKDPAATQKEIAKRLGSTQATVHNFFHSKQFEVLVVEAARQQLKALVVPAIRVLSKCLESNDLRVAHKAAINVLENVGVVVQGGVKGPTEDNRVQIMWNAPGAMPPPPIKIESPAQDQASA